MSPRGLSPVEWVPPWWRPGGLHAASCWCILCLISSFTHCRCSILAETHTVSYIPCMSRGTPGVMRSCWCCRTQGYCTAGLLAYSLHKNCSHSPSHDQQPADSLQQQPGQHPRSELHRLAKVCGLQRCAVSRDPGRQASTEQYWQAQSPPLCWTDLLHWWRFQQAGYKVDIREEGHRS